MKAKVLLIAGLALGLIPFVLPTTGEDSFPTESVDLTFQGSDFDAGNLDALEVSEAGLTLNPDSNSGHYLSTIIEAPFPFNAVVPQWVAEIPDLASMTIQLRTGTDSGWWSEWFTIHENHDWTLPDDPDMVGEMITVPGVDGTHDFLQYAVSFSRFASARPAILEELRLTLIDSTLGPSVEAMVESQRELYMYAPESEEGGYPKPMVIDRGVWCNHPACNYTDELKYESVTHLILHHTVSNNSSSDWAAVVRAIWSFHTFTRGWGDIGYNYLVDMNGVIYEGHLGGDDVVGTHAADANTGSMALAMIGDFRTVTPPSAMRDSAASLFSWKADQKNIDVYDASVLPKMDWGLPHLMGHRDVYGTTQCPGDKAHTLLPWLRGEVASRINSISPYIYIDELSNAFTRSSSSTWNSTADLSIPGCGFNGHSYYTWSTTDPAKSSEWAEWRPAIGATGLYEVQVYAPFCKTGKGETAGARYTVQHANGANEVVVNQNEGVGTWMPLGSFNFNVGTSGVVRLSDLTTTDDGLGVWFDAIRLKPADACPIPVISNQEPAAKAWINQRTVSFKWALSGAFCVKNTTLEVATDINFTDPVISIALAGAPSSHEITFTKDYPVLYWRVVTVSTQNQVARSTPSHFGIDTEAPSSLITAVYKTYDNQYVLSLQGQDAGSGVAGYNIDYRLDNDGLWQRWLTDAPSATLIIPWSISESTWFRSQAIDALGHTEPLHNGNGDINTDQAIQLQRVIMFPQIWRD